MSWAITVPSATLSSSGASASCTLPDSGADGLTGALACLTPL